MTGGFQTQVFSQPAIGVAGDFASLNPYSMFDVGAAGLVAGANGVTVGRFAWVTSPLDANNGPSVANSSGAGNVSGLVLRNQQGLNTTFLSYAGMTVPAGLPVALATGGDFIVVNEGSAQALRGMKAYAAFATGAISFAAAGAPTTASATLSTIANGTAASTTGSITGNIMTVSAVASGTIFPGAVVSGTGVVSGTSVLAQISGTTGGVGTYYVDVPEQTVASTTLTITPLVLDASGGSITGTIALGDVVVSSSGTVTGTIAGALLASVYATNKYVLQRPNAFTTIGTATSGTVVVATNVETPWYALNSATAGEHVKISAPVTGFGSQLS